MTISLVVQKTKYPEEYAEQYAHPNSDCSPADVFLAHFLLCVIDLADRAHCASSILLIVHTVRPMVTHHSNKSSKPVLVLSSGSMSFDNQAAIHAYT